MKNLIFRRQFLLTNKSIESEGSWEYNKLPIKNRDLTLYSHPDLEVTQVTHNQRQIVLLGFVLDPFHPDYTNSKILEHLIKVSDLDDLFKEIENYSGRFVFLVSNDEGTYLFHDATGLRQVCYCFDQEDVYCGSTPNIINEQAEMDLDTDPSMQEFMDSPEYKASNVWFGRKTPIKNIFHLQPNFYLDLNKKSTHRYWPLEKRKEISLSEGVELMSVILRGIMKSATNRYELYQGLTAGYESRLLLSASKGLTDKIKYLVNGTANASVGDYKIPKKLAAAHMLNFKKVEIKHVEVDEQFREIFFQNNLYARETHLKVFYDAYKKQLDKTIWVTGSFGNQLLRIDFPIKKKRISSSDIAARFQYRKYSYAKSVIEAWLNEAEPVVMKTGYDLMTLFFWEQFTANMQNLGASEGDIIREEMRPLNCRKLIATYNSLNDRYRYRHFPMGYIKMIETLWDDLLDIPLAVYPDSGRYWIRRGLRLFGMEYLVYNIYTQVKTWFVFRYS